MVGHKQRRLVALGQGFDPRCQVHRVADGGAIHAVLAAHGAQPQRPGVDADANLDRQAIDLLAFLVVGVQGVLHGDRRLHRIIGPAREQRHDRIADELVDKAVVGGDRRFHPRQVGIDEPEIFRRRHVFRQRGEGANVGKQHRHLPFHLIPQLHINNAVLFQQFQKFVGDKTAIGQGQVREFEVGLQAGVEFLTRHGFGYIVIGPRFQALDNVLNLVFGGEHHDR